jgi:mRNA interferase RelE/StbE
MRKFDKPVARRIVDFMDERVARLENPRSIGAALRGPEKLWRYRVGDYRIICEIQDSKLVVLVVEIGHRSDIYR